MKVRVFTLPWKPELGGFDDGKVSEFLQVRNAIDVCEHFFVHEKMPVLVLVVTYREPDNRSVAPARHGGSQAVATELANDLAPEERERYEALRVWRNQYARRAGKPPYVVFTNRQAQEIARRAPTSRTQLMEVTGLGESRLDDFGQELLAFLASLHGGATAQDETSTAVGAGASSAPVETGVPAGGHGASGNDG
ncbi:MAG: HRDC domain-containing protein [Cyanobacteria bacterium REEB65]|nr:HRDC domain-containing protein [Cyanobacteria bacterium REEB65]